MGSPRPRSVRSGAHVLYQHRLPQPRRPTSSGTTALYRSRYCCRMHIASLYMTNYQTNPSFTKILKLYNQIYDKYALYPLITKLQTLMSLYDQYMKKNNLEGELPTYIQCPFIFHPNTTNHTAKYVIITN